MLVHRSLTAITALLVAGACSPDSPTPLGDGPDLVAQFALRPNTGAPAPAELRTVSFGAQQLTLWPYLGEDVTGLGTDPVNLLFVGRSDPRLIRAALMGLDGDRTAFGMPASAPFDCRWTDTPSGGVQAAWTEEGGWIGSAIQLACGDFGPIRFHLRLARSGRWTVGGAHFEALIPGTADHQVLSWELAEQLVTVDLMRTGLLGQDMPLSPTAAINTAPAFRTIPAIIFNSLPAQLQAIVTGAPGNASGDVPIPTDGRATIFNLARAVEIRPDDVHHTFTLTYGQVIPKPFCNGPNDYVYVQGPITLDEVVSVNSRGRYTSSFTASAQLAVIPVNPLTGQPSGPTAVANVSERHASLIGEDRQYASSAKLQELLPLREPGHGRLVQTLAVDSYAGTAAASTRVRCTP